MPRRYTITIYADGDNYGGDEKAQQPVLTVTPTAVPRLQLIRITQRLDRVERRLEVLGAQPLPKPAGTAPAATPTAQAPTTPTRRPRPYDTEGRQLCFSSVKGEAACREALVDWERPGVDTERKSLAVPDPLRWAYRGAGLTRAKRGEKPVFRWTIGRRQETLGEH